MAPVNKPLYFVVDISSNNPTHYIGAVNNIIKQFVSILLQDPYAIESDMISIIGYGEKPKLILSLSHVMDFEVPSIGIDCSKVSDLGNALDFVCNLILSDELLLREEDNRVDHWPYLFVFTNNNPSGLLDFLIGVTKIKNLNLSYVGLFKGNSVDEIIMSQLTGNIYDLNSANGDSLIRILHNVFVIKEEGSMEEQEILCYGHNVK